MLECQHGGALYIQFFVNIPARVKYGALKKIPVVKSANCRITVYVSEFLTDLEAQDLGAGYLHPR